MRNIIEAGLKKIVPNEPTFATGSREATVIAIAAQKGGVGKTTTAVNLASALALQHNQRVLIIDIDGQGHTGASLGIGEITTGETLSTVLLTPFKQEVLSAVVETDIPNLHVTAPDPGLSEAEAVLSSRVGREFILREAMVTARTHYDTILIDCPPNLGNLTLNALMASDHILVPCDMSTLAMDGVASLLEAVGTIQGRLRHDLTVLGILRTRVDRRNIVLNDAVDEALKQTYPHLLLETVIPINNALAKGQAVGESIHTFAPRSTGANAYHALGDEVLARLELRVQARAHR
jgi:chromosome partitioning protein